MDIFVSWQIIDVHSRLRNEGRRKTRLPRIWIYGITKVVSERGLPEEDAENRERWKLCTKTPPPSKGEKTSVKKRVASKVAEVCFLSDITVALYDTLGRIFLERLSLQT
jgi:hypothetical protein